MVPDTHAKPVRLESTKLSLIAATKVLPNTVDPINRSVLPVFPVDYCGGSSRCCTGHNPRGGALASPNNCGLVLKAQFSSIVGTEQQNDGIGSTVLSAEPDYEICWLVDRSHSDSFDMFRLVGGHATHSEGDLFGLEL